MSEQTKNTNSMDFLGQKRRIRPVRKVQVSTHFDELEINRMSSITPEPPGFDEKTIIRATETDNSNSFTISKAEPRSAAYASKIQISPTELNTLVPEDFNLIDFNLSDLNSRKTRLETDLKIDHTFEAMRSQVISKSYNVQSSDECFSDIQSIENNQMETLSDKINPSLKLISAIEPATNTLSNEVTQFQAKTIIKENEMKALTTTTNQLEDSPEINPLSSQYSPREVLINRDSLLKVSEARNSLQLATETTSTNMPLSCENNAFKEDNLTTKYSFNNENIKSVTNLSDSGKNTNTQNSSKQISTSENKEKLSPVFQVPIASEISSSEKEFLKSPESIKSASTTTEIESSISPLPLKINSNPIKSFNIKDDVEEISAPPPLPTDVSHLTELRKSLKPSLLPVKPVNGAPSTEERINSPVVMKDLTANSSPLRRSEITAEDLEKLMKQLEQQKIAVEQEMKSKSALEIRIESLNSKSGAQEEALQYKNDKLNRIESEYLKLKNDLISINNEKAKLKEKLDKTLDELANTNDTNAKVYLEKSDEVNALKDKLASFAVIIGQNNKDIDSLNRQIEEIKRNNLQTALENIKNHENVEDELIKLIEDEILRMQDTIEEQRVYNTKLQMEVDAENKFWNQILKENID